MDPLLVAILAYLLGLGLFTVDIFLPSGGILLFCSGGAAIISVVFGFRAGTTAGLSMMLLVLGSIPAMLYAFLKIWPHTPIGRRVLLTPPDSNSKQGEADLLKDLIGKVVNNKWPLIPTGQIQIGHKRYNAMSQDGKTIEVGNRVKVIDVHERMLVVVATSEPLTDLSTGHAKALAESPTQQALVNPENIPAQQLGLDSLEELPLDEAE